MTPFSAEQLPIIARRILVERDAGREVDPLRIGWAKDILAYFDRGDAQAGRRCFIDAIDDGSEDAKWDRSMLSLPASRAHLAGGGV